MKSLRRPQHRGALSAMILVSNSTFKRLFSPQRSHNLLCLFCGFRRDLTCLGGFFLLVCFLYFLACVTTNIPTSVTTVPLLWHHTTQYPVIDTFCPHLNSISVFAAKPDDPIITKVYSPSSSFHYFEPNECKHMGKISIAQKKRQVKETQGRCELIFVC